MTHTQFYPGADHSTEWADGAFARGTFSTVEKLCLHSTETTGLPGYAGCSMAPTITFDPRTLRWTQHNQIGDSARALEDPTTTAVRENRDNVVQIEIIAYADEATGKRVGGTLVSQLSDAALRELGFFAGWLHMEWGLPLQSTVTWKDYPASYGASNGVRLSGPDYDAYRGILGHEHVSGNHHGDPGGINIARILQYARAYVAAHEAHPAVVVTPSRSTTRPALHSTAPVIHVANIRPGLVNADVAAYAALLWKAQGPVYRALHKAAWMREPSHLYGPMCQKVTLDTYRSLHAADPKNWSVPASPCWPGPALIRHIGGDPR